MSPVALVTDTSRSIPPITPETMTIRLHANIRETMRMLFPDEKKLHENFEAGCFESCTNIIYDQIMDRKKNLLISSERRAKREQFFYRFQAWSVKYGERFRQK